YLIAYFGMMLGTIILSLIKNRINSNKIANTLIAIVGSNIAIWFIEQLIDTNFEFLSVSYIITEVFLLFLYMMLQDYGLLPTRTEKKTSICEERSENAETENIHQKCASETAVTPADTTNSSEDEYNKDFIERYQYFVSNLNMLTPTERKIYNFYLSGKSTKEIRELLQIKENTLKFHNKNIYSKLGVSSRKELLSFANRMNSDVIDG
ncbi:MAG: helix-turn-helix transcriptional regulator, partial [Hominilimicola sp.]